MVKKNFVIKVGDQELYVLEDLIDTPNFHGWIELNGTDFCYLYTITGAENVPVDLVPVALELAMRDGPPRDGIVQVSVSTRENHYKAWLEQAENYPGASCITVPRTGYTCYLLHFPVTPKEL